MKTFIGTIRNWGFTSDRISGQCHALMQPRTTLAEGESMTTSQVVGVLDMEGFYIVETRFSRYIALGEPMYDLRKDVS